MSCSHGIAAVLPRQPEPLGGGSVGEESGTRCCRSSPRLGSLGGSSAFAVLPAGLLPALLRAGRWVHTGHPPNRARPFPSPASPQPCRVMPGSALPLAQEVSEVSGLANPEVP